MPKIVHQGRDEGDLRLRGVVFVRENSRAPVGVEVESVVLSGVLMTGKFVARRAAMSAAQATSPAARGESSWI